MIDQGSDSGEIQEHYFKAQDGEGDFCECGEYFTHPCHIRGENIYKP